MLSLDLEPQASIIGNIGIYSYGTAMLAYAMLVILAFITRRTTPMGMPLLAASSLTTLWASAVTLSLLLTEPKFELVRLTEAARNAAWLFVLFKFIGQRIRDTDHTLATSRWVLWFFACTAIIFCFLFGAVPLAEDIPVLSSAARKASFSIWLASSILGLLLLEQLFRNSNEHELWACKHLCVGLGLVFTYDFFMYAQALLFQQLDKEVWQARGFATTMAAILIATSLSRWEHDKSRDYITPDHEPGGLYLSRHVAFHSLTLMAAGIYLITMALAAYFVSYLGGTWGGVFQIVFLCGAGMILAVLLFSGRIRARMRVWLSKNFFSYKYDYRLEWLEFTRALASENMDVPENITRAVANLAQSPAGILWSLGEDGRFDLDAHWQMPPPQTTMDLRPIAGWLQQNEWIIDIDEWKTEPDLYGNLKMPREVAEIPGAWLVIPLLFGERLQGMLLLRRADQARDLNWEDRDLLKVAGKQAASQLAQHQADKALGQSRQFEAFNRLSAYVIHDLKNILAQLSLVVANAQKHKQNPEFIDDMVDTVSNTVNRMNSLMAQLREGDLPQKPGVFGLQQLLTSVVKDSEHRLPSPRLEVENDQATLECDRERLHSVFEHLIQNAQEATDDSGYVTVRVKGTEGIALIEIEDNGVGMDEEFLRQRLFKPFDSTKGLTGMGIGVFESRDFVRSLGGDIEVQSKPGEGSLFKVNIPCSSRIPEATATASLEENLS
ncbi:PEP-CTERM system histidine kinase PrsK [Halioglobus sp.]|nr:PEP-CTERM system histidine kinase PrsK [Halioglobus sp.]